jgi:hypothetical protein
MTEVPKPQPMSQEGGPTPELPIREAFLLPSKAILEGMWQGQIRNPEAMRGYVLGRRNEFLRAHPNREDELDGPGEIGRWNRLVFSDTRDEYSGLAALCESEIHRRMAGLSGSQLDNSVHLQGVANLRRMADSWRQRAAQRAGIESLAPLPDHPAEPQVHRPVAVSGTIGQEEPAICRPNYERMLDYEVLDGIDNGTLTDTEAVHVHISKSLQSVRELSKDDERKAEEAEYAELVYGAPEDMIQFCLRQASEHLAYGTPGAISPAHYKIASRWYAMAGRFAQKAAVSDPVEETQTRDEE